MISAAESDLFARMHTQYPQFEKVLTRMYEEELSGLPNADLDKVQKLQGRVLFIQGFLDHYRHAAGITANRTAKPQL